MIQELKKQASDLGFAVLGVADPEVFDDYPRVPRTPGSEEFRPRPGEAWSACRSVVVVALHTRDEVFDVCIQTDEFYAVFHQEMIQNRLRKLTEWLSRKGHEARPAPAVSAKRAAVLAGLGHMGRNGLIAHPEYGSDIRLGVLLTDALLPLDSPNDPFEPAPCGGCRRCEEICPVGAVRDYEVDYTACLRQGESTGGRTRALPEESLQRRGPFFLVCNLCQRICPLNDGRIPAGE